MEMALKELEELVNEDPRDFRPYLYQVNLIMAC